MKLNSREYILGLRTNQLSVFHDQARFRLLVAGRRFGKTQLALTEMLIAAQTPGARIWYIAPSRPLAKDVAWERLKKITRPYWSKKPTSTDLTVYTTFNSTISLRSADRPDSLRGRGLTFAVLDEFADMHPDTWDKCIRPALSDRIGRALFIGTPRGHNHFYERFNYARRAKDPEWAAFQFTTAQGGIVSLDEIRAAASSLDLHTFQQEYEGQFIGTGHQHVYYAFNRDIHVRPLKFDPMRPLVWTLDFNVNPMCMLLIQRMDHGIVHVFEEIILRNANTEEACRVFLDRLEPKHKLIPAYQRPLNLQIFGDASGNQDRTSAAETDWTIIRNFFAHWKGQISPSIHVNNVNPAVKDRVNCVNSRLLNVYQEPFMFIDPRCVELIRDLEQIVWKVEKNGTTGKDINKSDPNRTHMSDALGYFIAQAFPLRTKVGHNDSGPLPGISS